jgi:hypothetical protein
LRGVIDYLVVNDRAVTVAASERGQLEVLLEVAAALFPGRDVRGIVVSNGVTSELRREEKGDSSGQLELF